MQEPGIATLNLENFKRIDMLLELMAKLPRLDVLPLRKARMELPGPEAPVPGREPARADGLDRSFLTHSTLG